LGANKKSLDQTFLIKLAHANMVGLFYLVPKSVLNGLYRRPLNFDPKVLTSL